MATDKIGNKLFYLLFALDILFSWVLFLFILAIIFGIFNEALILMISLILTILFSIFLFNLRKKPKMVFVLWSAAIIIVATLLLHYFVFSIKFTQGIPLAT